MVNDVRNNLYQRDREDQSERQVSGHRQLDPAVALSQHLRQKKADRSHDQPTESGLQVRWHPQRFENVVFNAMKRAQIGDAHDRTEGAKNYVKRQLQDVLKLQRRRCEDRAPYAGDTAIHRVRGNGRDKRRHERRGLKIHVSIQDFRGEQRPSQRRAKNRSQPRARTGQ